MYQVPSGGRPARRPQTRAAGRLLRLVRRRLLAYWGHGPNRPSETPRADRRALNRRERGAPRGAQLRTGRVHRGGVESAFALRSKADGVWPVDVGVAPQRGSGQTSDRPGARRGGAPMRTGLAVAATVLMVSAAGLGTPGLAADPDFTHVTDIL